MNSNNRKIIRNTGLLYFRQFFLMLISLYTVRVTLLALGIEDYGIFNVIATSVWTMSVLSGAMTSASQRFLSFHLGKNDFVRYSRTYSMLVMSFIALSLIMLVLSESLGYFLVYDWLSIPPDRKYAAMWVFQMSVLSFICIWIKIPYTSSIIANERMDAFAVFSIVEGLINLAIAILIIHYGGDRLILYSILYCAVSISSLVMTIVYCNVYFKYCRYTIKFDKKEFKDLFTYTGWNILGSVSGLLISQGHNLVLNIFFGPVINAAKGIADKVQTLITGFSMNVYMAVSPQIIKSYAAQEYERTKSLVIKSSKMSFMLIFILSFPLMCNLTGIFGLWLEADAKSADMLTFARLTLLYCLVISLEPPISRLVQATGNIRNYQISVSVLTFLFLPACVLVLKLGASASSTFVVLICVMVLAQIVRVIVAHRQVGLDYGEYYRNVLFPVVRVFIVGVALYFAFVEYNRYQGSEGVTMLVVSTLVTAIAGLFIVLVVGLNNDDRLMLSQLIKNKLKR